MSRFPDARRIFTYDDEPGDDPLGNRDFLSSWGYEQISPRIFVRGGRFVTSPHTSHLPHTTRRAHLDNLALLAGSMPPQIEELHRVAHELPGGVMLVIGPAEGHPQRGIHEKVIPMLRAAGYRAEVREATTVQNPQD